MGTMKIVVTQSFGSQVIEKKTQSFEIAPFNMGSRQMLEANESTTTTATGNITLLNTDTVIQVIDPGGADRVITLPAEDNSNHGFLIINTADADEDLVVKDDAAVELATVYQGGAGWFISNGSAWKSVGLGTYGYRLQNDGSDMTAREKINLIGFKVEDDGANDVTKVSNRGKNSIINGAMDIWQRGSTTISVGTGYSSAYFPDRFAHVTLTGDGTYDLSRSTETPTADFPFQYSMKLDCTHIETAVAAGETLYWRYLKEGYDFKKYEGETATLSFWVKATKTGTYCIAFQNATNDKSYVVEYTVNTTNTWERKEVTLTFDSGGTFLYTNGVGLNISWAIMSGSTFQTTADAWQDGNYNATANQVNGMDSTDNNFQLTGVQMELGDSATDFAHRPYAEELALCQRYYELSGNGQFRIQANGTFVFSISQPFAVAKRTAPTLVLYAGLDHAGTAGSIRRNALIDIASSANNAIAGGFVLTTSGTYAFSLNDYVQWSYIAHCEL